MRLYSFIFMPALLFSLYRYDYLPLNLSPNTKVPKLLVFEELYGKRTYVVSQYDKEGRIYVKRFFDTEGLDLGYIRYSYLNGKIATKQYFSYKRAGDAGGFARQIKYNYDELGKLRDAQISSYGDNYYIEYEEFDEGQTYEESWYLTTEKRFRIQMRKMYYREGILQREEIYTKPGADENIKLIYSRQLNYDVAGELLDIIYYDTNGAQIKQLKYIYTQRGLLERIVVGMNMLDFIHKDLGMRGTRRRYTTVLFVHDLNSIKYPKSVAQALNPPRVIARKPDKMPKKPEPKPEEVKKPQPKPEPKKAVIKKPQPKPQSKEPEPKIEPKQEEIKKPEPKKELAGWFLETKRTITTDIAQGSDSDIVVGFAPGVIAKISLKDKRYIWEYKVDSRIIISPVIEDGGRERIVFGTESGTLYCISKDGKLLWKRDIGSFLKNSHLLLHHNIVYAQHSNYKLTAHTVETGNVLWYFDPKERLPKYISSIFRSEENIYFAIDNIIYVFDPNSGYIWSYVTDKYIVTQPVVHEEIIYVSFEDDLVAYSISRENLRELWSIKDIKIKGRVYVSASEDGKGSLYGVTDRGFIVNIALGNTQLSWRTRLNKTNVLLSGNEKYLFINLLSDYILVIDLQNQNILGSYNAVSDLERISINSPKYIISNISEDDKFQQSQEEVIVTSLNISINDSSTLIYGTSLGNIYHVSYSKDKK